MCIIAYCKNSTKLDKELLSKFHSKNPDGAGLAYWNGKEWEVVKGLMNLEEIITKLNELQLLDREVHNDFVIHFRKASKGKVIPELTHPFEIKLIDDELYLFHNGTMRIAGVRYCSPYVTTSYSPYYRSSIGPNCDADYNSSDTSKFCELITELEITRKQFEMMIKENGILHEVINDSRLCLLYKDDQEPVFIGDWSEHNGLKVSNLQFLIPDTPYTTYTSTYGTTYTSSYSSSYTTSSYTTTTEEDDNYYLDYYEKYKTSRKGYYDYYDDMSDYDYYGYYVSYDNEEDDKKKKGRKRKKKR